MALMQPARWSCRQLRRRHVLAFFQKRHTGGDRGVRVTTPLVRESGVGAYGAIDASGLCEALRLQRIPIIVGHSQRA